MLFPSAEFQHDVDGVPLPDSAGWSGRGGHQLESVLDMEGNIRTELGRLAGGCSVREDGVEGFVSVPSSAKYVHIHASVWLST